MCMKYKKKNLQINAGAMLLYAVFVIVMLIIIAQKKNYHVDEVLTYGLANHHNTGTIMIEFEQKQKYIPADTVWMDYMCVKEGYQFDFCNVWKNQKMDVHPPLYYTLIHTISSLFPNQFSKWFAGVINIFFAVFTLYNVRRITDMLCCDDKAKIVVSLFFASSSAILSMAAFFRMYMMAMFWVTEISYLFVKAQKENNTGLSLYLRIFGVSVFGTLTHYYFLIYLFFICVVFGIYQVYERKFKQAFMLCGSMLAAGVAVIITFPAIITHIFLGGYRGQESFQNLKQMELGTIGNRLKEFCGFVNNEVFGGLLVLVLTIAIVELITKRKEKEKIICYLMLIIPSVGYWLLIAKIAVMNISRYLYPIWAIIIICGIGLTYDFSKRISTRRRILVYILLAVISVNNLRTCNWEYLYLESGQLIEQAKQHSDEDCILVLGERNKDWRILTAYEEVKNYHSVTFIFNEELSTKDLNNESAVICFYKTLDGISLLNQIVEENPQWNEYQKLGEYGYTESYYVY